MGRGFAGRNANKDHARPLWKRHIPGRLASTPRFLACRGAAALMASWIRLSLTLAAPLSSLGQSPVVSGALSMLVVYGP